MANNVITLENCKSYATEKNLDAALEKFGLNDYSDGYSFNLRFIKCRNADGRWTAIFMVSEFFSVNMTGGYVGIASQYGFMSI